MIKNLWLAAGLWWLACARPPADESEVFQGIIEFEQVDLGFEYPGRLAQLWVRRGDRVDAGARVAALDDALEQASLRARESEAEAESARAALVAAGSRKEEVRALSARLRAADALITQLRDRLRRDVALMESGVTPPATVDELRAELDRARAERAALAEQRDLLVAGPLREELSQANSRARAGQALAELQRERTGRFELASPLSGEVIDHHFLPGEFVPQGAPVVSIADTARPVIDVFVPEERIAGVELGARAEVRMDGLDAAIPARVEHIATRTEFTPRFLFSERERPNLVVRVRLHIDDPDRRLRAGLPARARIGAEHVGGE